MNKTTILSAIAAGAAGLSLIVSAGTAVTVNQDKPHSQDMNRSIAASMQQGQPETMQGGHDMDGDQDRGRMGNKSGMINKGNAGGPQSSDIQMNQMHLNNGAPQVNTYTGGSN